MKIVLHQFAKSHFNEKARWGLAFKGIEYERRTYLPGPHMPVIKKLSGQAQTPVLQVDEQIIAGSAKILEQLEQLKPEPALLPTDPDAREAALSWQQKLDVELGPAVRTQVFEQMIDHGSYLVRMFAGEKPWLTRWGYRAMYPLAKPLIAKGNGVTDPDNLIRTRETVSRYLEEIGTQIANTDYLVGERFSLADLTAAALLAPIASVDHADMTRPQPPPPGFVKLIASYAEHPTIKWVRTMYSRHRS